MNLQLDYLLTYSNERVLKRYAKDYPFSRLASDVAMKEFIKYVWLVLKHQSDCQEHLDDTQYKFDCMIYEEMKAIDDLWHTFLLFTKDYQVFCNEYLNGYFFHHQPSEEGARVVDKKVYLNHLEKYLNYIQLQLGEETLRLWFNLD